MSASPDDDARKLTEEFIAKHGRVREAGKAARKAKADVDASIEA